MRRLRDLIKKKKKTPRGSIDEKSIFYVFESIIKAEYGRKGVENVKPVLYKGKKLFLRSRRSTWTNEIWASKEDLIEKINKKIGSKEVIEIKVKN